VFDGLYFFLIRFYETGSVKPGSIGGTKPKVRANSFSNILKHTVSVSNVN
jgi:hypothetical protein